MMIPYLYKWTELSTNKWYIGSRTRKGCHPNDGYICSSKIVKPMILSNPENWSRTVILFGGDPEKIIELENFMLQDLDAKHDPMSYNLHNGDRKFSASGKKLPRSKEHAAKISAAKKGVKRKPHSLETKLKIKEALLARGGPRLGATTSQETKEKIRNSLTGRKLSKEHVANIILAKQTKKDVNNG